MSSRSLPFATAFNEIFLNFLDLLSPGTRHDRGFVENLSAGALDPSDDERMIRLTQSFRAPTTAYSLAQLQAGLASAVHKSVADYDSGGFQSFVDRHLSIAPMSTVARKTEGDFVYIKINHGFWEQLFALFSKEIDPQRMRVVTRQPHGALHRISILAALDQLILDAGEIYDGRVSFRPLHFGLSLSNGDQTHQEILSGFDGFGERERRVMSGAAIGACSFFDALFPGKTIQGVDGCFPKVGLSTRLLEATIHDHLPRSDRVIFAVPNHLAGIELAIANLPQDHILISGTHVHQAWLGTLHSCSRRILGHLWHGESVLVVTQSGVFSALLGLFLARAKRELAIAEPRLSYFDLGQVTDIANPEAAGPWVRNTDPEPMGLFTIARPN